MPIGYHKFEELKKIHGHKSAYRKKNGDFRIGFFLINKQIYLARALDRK